MEEIKTSKISLIIPLLIVVCNVSFPAYAKYSGGTGEPNNPYKIATAEDLMLLGESSEDYDKHFIMIDDIDLDPNLPGRKVFDRTVIGSFNGVFNGNGHIISNMKIEGGSFLNLFGQSGSGVRIQNLGLEAVDVNGTGNIVGGLVGSTFYGSITDCYVTGSVHGTADDVGGLVGSNSGNIDRCYSTSAISGRYCVGGLVGANSHSITNSYSNGMVLGEFEVAVWWELTTMTETLEDSFLSGAPLIIVIPQVLFMVIDTWGDCWGA